MNKGWKDGKKRLQQFLNEASLFHTVMVMVMSVRLKLLYVQQLLPFSSRMFFLSNTAYSVAPDGVLTDWSNGTEPLNRKRKKKTKNRWNEMDLLCIYPTVFTEQMSMIFFCFVFAYLLFFCLFLLKPGPPYPVYTCSMFNSTIAIVTCSFLKVCVLVSRLLAIKIKARY